MSTVRATTSGPGLSRVMARRSCRQFRTGVPADVLGTEEVYYLAGAIPDPGRRWSAPNSRCRQVRQVDRAGVDLSFQPLRSPRLYERHSRRSPSTWAGSKRRRRRRPPMRPPISRRAWRWSSQPPSSPSSSSYPRRPLLPRREQLCEQLSHLGSGPSLLPDQCDCGFTPESVSPESDSKWFPKRRTIQEGLPKVTTK